MSDMTPDDAHPAIIKAGVSDFERVIVTHADSVEIIMRLRETQADTQRRAFILKLDSLIEKLGARWDAKAEMVQEHLRKGFTHLCETPNWCAQIAENLWLAVIPSLNARQGAQACANIWSDTTRFFIGETSDARPPLFEVRVETPERLRLRRIDLTTFFDRDEPSGTRQAVRLPGMNTAEPDRYAMPASGVSFTKVEASRPQSVPLVIAGRDVRVACAIEPVFELKNLSLIGHRLEPLVTDLTGRVHLDSKALKDMDWGDREKVDLANIDEGLKLLATKLPAQRKILIVAPVAFSTLASTRGRLKATSEIAKSATNMSMKVLFEVRGLSGVPSHRIAEVVGLVKPYCMAVVAHVGMDMRTLQNVKQCGFSGICFSYDGNTRDQVALHDYLQDLTVAAKKAAGACMIQGFDNLRQIAVARLAGVSHASVKASALLSTAARSP